MSNKPGSPPLYHQKNVSLVARAIQEFNKVSIKPETSNQNQDKNKDLPPNKKGANPLKRRSGLGRGLSSLMSSTVPTVDVSLSSDDSFDEIKSNESIAKSNEEANRSALAGTDSQIEKLHAAKLNTTIQGTSNTVSGPTGSALSMLSIDRLSPNPNQPRQEFSQKEIRELASSIRRSGMIQPILVRPIEPLKSSSFQEYQIVAGERRWRAAKEAGLISVPAIIKELNERDTLELGIIENVQRQDLNPIEEALAYQKLISEFGTTQDELAKIVGKDRSSISNTIRLLALPLSVQNLLKERKLSAGHARAILSLENTDDQERLAKELVEAKLSVRETEQKVAEVKKNSKAPSEEKKAQTTIDTELEERLRRALGTKVKVNMSSSGKGEIKISFFSKPEFEAFMEKIDA